MGSGIQAVGTALASDKELKKDIEDFDPSEFLDSLTPHKYKYKDPKFGAGTYAGPMAQELEKAGPIGESMVMDTDEGKMVDARRAALAGLAGLADHEERLKKMEDEELHLHLIFGMNIKLLRTNI